MTPWHRISKTAILVLALIGGLTLGSTPSSPLAHADDTPLISASWVGGLLNVTGTGFTPGGAVLVQVDGEDITTLGGTLYDTVSASPVDVTCVPSPGCAPTLPGSIFDSFKLDGSYNHTVSAYDFSTDRWSNVVTVPAWCTASRIGCGVHL